MNKKMGSIVLGIGGVFLIFGIILYFTIINNPNNNSGEISVNNKMVQNLASWVTDNGKCPSQIIKSNSLVTADTMDHNIMYALVFRQLELDGKIGSAQANKVSKELFEETLKKLFNRVPLYSVKYAITYNSLEYVFIAVENAFLSSPVTVACGEQDSYKHEIYKAVKNNNLLEIYIKEENVSLEWKSYKYIFETKDNGKSYFLVSMNAI